MAWRCSPHLLWSPLVSPTQETAMHSQVCTATTMAQSVCVDILISKAHPCICGTSRKAAHSSFWHVLMKKEQPESLPWKAQLCGHGAVKTTASQEQTPEPREAEGWKTPCCALLWALLPAMHWESGCKPPTPLYYRQWTHSHCVKMMGQAEVLKAETHLFDTGAQPTKPSISPSEQCTTTSLKQSLVLELHFSINFFS